MLNLKKNWIFSLFKKNYAAIYMKKIKASFKIWKCKNMKKIRKISDVFNNFSFIIFLCNNYQKCRNEKYTKKICKYLQ